MVLTVSFVAATLGGCAAGPSPSNSQAEGGSNNFPVGGDNASGGSSGGQNPGGNNTGGSLQGGGNQGGSAQGGQGGGATGGSGQGAAGPGDLNDGKGVFEAPNVWTKNIGGLDKSPSSDSIVQWLAANGGWGGGQMKIDFGITVLAADNSTPKKDFTPTDEFYAPDCDQVQMPVPAGGALEAEDGYECTQDGDCHLLVVHKGEKKLYEMWRANITGGTFYGGCAAVWDLTRTYPDDLRGEGCTSADAGGFPIAAMLFSVDEVANGAIKHALRFILPNQRIRENVYVHPGTHSTFSTSGGSDAPPYGVRMRLRKDFPLASLPSDGARVIAKALQEYGMFLADGGTIALTGQSDRFSQTTWDDVNVDSFSLTSIQVNDMEVVDMGTPINWSQSCERNP